LCELRFRPPDYLPAFRQLAVIIDGLRSRMRLGAAKRFWLFAKTPAIPIQLTITAAIRRRGGSPAAKTPQDGGFDPCIQKCLLGRSSEESRDVRSIGR
jgi:hypothetical protein